MSLAKGFGEGGKDGGLDRGLGFVPGYSESEISFWGGG